jgi:anti-sigma factor RsiW
VTHVFDLLSAHLDGELSEAETRVVSAHLDECARCAEELDDIAAIRGAVRGLPMVEPPVPLLPTVRRQRRWITAASSVAAAALAVGLAFGPGEPGQILDLDSMAGQHTTRLGVDPAISTLRGSVGP